MEFNGLLAAIRDYLDEQGIEYTERVTEKAPPVALFHFIADENEYLVTIASTDLGKED